MLRQQGTEIRHQDSQGNEMLNQRYESTERRSPGAESMHQGIEGQHPDRELPLPDPDWPRRDPDHEAALSDPHLRATYQSAARLNEEPGSLHRDTERRHEDTERSHEDMERNHLGMANVFPGTEGTHPDSAGPRERPDVPYPWSEYIYEEFGGSYQRPEDLNLDPDGAHQEPERPGHGLDSARPDAEWYPHAEGPHQDMGRPYQELEAPQQATEAAHPDTALVHQGSDGPPAKGPETSSEEDYREPETGRHWKKKRATNLCSEPAVQGAATGQRETVSDVRYSCGWELLTGGIHQFETCYKRYLMFCSYPVYLKTCNILLRE